MEWKSIDLKDVCAKVDPVVGMRENWFLVTAETDGKANALTAGWGALGNVWEKKTVTVYIRPQRYTKRFMDASGRFTLTFFDGHQQEMGYLGSHSGADVPDKIEKSGLHLTHVEGQPTYEEGKWFFLCRTLYKQAIRPECFLDEKLAQSSYPDKDYSIMYVAEIEAAYELVTGH